MAQPPSWERSFCLCPAWNSLMSTCACCLLPSYPAMLWAACLHLLHDPLVCTRRWLSGVPKPIFSSQSGFRGRTSQICHWQQPCSQINSLPLSSRIQEKSTKTGPPPAMVEVPVGRNGPKACPNPVWGTGAQGQTICSPPPLSRHGGVGLMLAGMVVSGWRLDLMSLEVFSNLNDSVIPAAPAQQQAQPSPAPSLPLGTCRRPRAVGQRCPGCGWRCHGPPPQRPRSTTRSASAALADKFLTGSAKPH